MVTPHAVLSLNGVGWAQDVRDARGVGPHVMWFITVREEDKYTIYH